MGYSWGTDTERHGTCQGVTEVKMPWATSKCLSPLACQPVHHPVDGQHDERILNSSPRAPLENNGCVSQAGWLGQSKADVSGLSTVENVLWLRSVIALMAGTVGVALRIC